MTREECEKAIEIIDNYIYYDNITTPRPSIKEVREAIKTLGILVSGYFKLVDHLESM